MSHRFHHGPLPHLEMWEAEACFQEVLGRVRSTTDLHLLQAHPIGDYWEEGWARAPFEECLTLKQILGIDLQSFIRKRSMTAEKLVAISYAMDKCLTGAPTLPQPTHAPSLKLKQEPKREHDRAWAAISPLVPPSVALIPEMVLREGASLPRGTTLARIALEIPKILSAEVVTILWLLGEVGEKEVHGRTGLPLKTIRSAVKDGHRALAELLQRVTPEVYLHWNTALTGPGAKEESLFSPYIATEGSLPFQLGMLRTLVQGIGATPPLINKKPLPGHWTLHPETAWKMIKAMKGSLKGSTAKKRELLSLPFPFYDLDLLLKSLSS